MRESNGSPRKDGAVGEFKEERSVYHDTLGGGRTWQCEPSCHGVEECDVVGAHVSKNGVLFGCKKKSSKSRLNTCICVGGFVEEGKVWNVEKCEN